MATSIPPHNLGEVIDACIALIEARDLTTFRLLTHVKGPDFPTGGQIHATKKELEAIYGTGQGSLKLRGEWRIEAEGEGKRGSAPPAVIVTSIPYGIERKVIVEKIAEVILSKKLPSLVDVRDESTAETRIVLELKRGADPQLVMAYLYKHTPLAVNVQVNLTCLVPAEGVDVTAPRRLNLQEILTQFLDFRYATVTRRTEFELAEIARRVHVLEGLEIVFDVLDEVIKIIRRSDGKADAAQRLIARFKLSEEQTDAILELRLYRLAKLEILVVRRELAEKRAEAKRLEALLKSETKRWALVQGELTDIRTKYGDKRRTKIMGSVDEPEFQAEDFIIAEDVSVILSAQGWVKRVREVKDLATTRLRDGDSVLAAVAGSTRASVAFFSSLGACYVCRIHDVPPSTGYGDPVQKLFKLADGERMIAMLSLDPRAIDVPAASDDAEEPEPPFALAITRGGLGFRFSLRPHRDPSTRAGRKYAKLNEGDEVLAVMPADRAEAVLCAASDGHTLGVRLDDIAMLSGSGKGSMVMKIDEGERLVGAILAMSEGDRMTVETEKGVERTFVAASILGTRGARGRPSDFKRDRFARVLTPPPAVPSLEVS
jgi:DNA gyrase subunit A